MIETADNLETADILYEIETTNSFSSSSVMESRAAAYSHSVPFSTVAAMPSNWLSILFPVDTDRSTSHASRIMVGNYADAYALRTRLAMKLLGLRQKAIDEGMRLLDADEVLDEVKRRRGEIETDETDLY